jgi:hypothetical protein
LLFYEWAKILISVCYLNRKRKRGQFGFGTPSSDTENGGTITENLSFLITGWL